MRCKLTCKKSGSSVSHKACHESMLAEQSTLRIKLTTDTVITESRNNFVAYQIYSPWLGYFSK